jgi:hypothetical protein
MSTGMVSYLFNSSRKGLKPLGRKALHRPRRPIRAKSGQDRADKQTADAAAGKSKKRSARPTQQGADRYKTYSHHGVKRALAAPVSGGVNDGNRAAEAGFLFAARLAELSAATGVALPAPAESHQCFHDLIFQRPSSQCLKLFHQPVKLAASLYRPDSASAHINQSLRLSTPKPANACPAALAGRRPVSVALPSGAPFGCRFSGPAPSSSAESAFMLDSPFACDKFIVGENFKSDGNLKMRKNLPAECDKLTKLNDWFFAFGVSWT